MIIINTRADLDALRGTEAYAEALRRILGATTMWINDAADDAPAVWRQASVGDVLASLDLTTEELLAECEAAGITPQTPPAPATIAAPAVDLVAYANNASWRKEVDGIIVDGIPIATDDRSQLKILGSRVAANANPAWSTVWDAADGISYPIAAATMIAISDAVEAHVNRCFAIRASVKAQIAAGTITTTAQIDTAFG